MKFSRLFPLVTSISTIALIAACARHDNSSTVSEETMELQAEKSLRATYGNVNIYDAEGMKLSANIEGADLMLNREVGKDSSSRDVDVDISVLMKDQDTAMVATGVVSQKAIMTLQFKDGRTDYSMTARCVSKDCANIVAELAKLSAKSASPVAATVPTSEGSDGAAASTESGTSSESGATSSGTVAEESSVMAPGPKAYLQFRVPQKDKKQKETKAMKESRQKTFNLFWSTPTANGKVKSGTTSSTSAALAARSGQKPSGKTASDTASDTETQTQTTQTQTTESETKKTQEDTAQPSSDQQSSDQQSSDETSDSQKTSSSDETSGSSEKESKSGEIQTQTQVTESTGPEIVVTATHEKVAKAQLDYAKELEEKATKETDVKKKEALLAEAKTWKEKAAASQAKADAKKKTA